MVDKRSFYYTFVYMNRVILHIDMDAFYAAVEQHDNPELRGKPVVIGSDPKQGKGRGVVSTASYEAREYGIHSAMPISESYRRCPHAVYIPPRIQRYSEVSRQIMDIFSHFSPYIEPLSLDEAFLDCSNMEKLLGTPDTIAQNIKNEVYAATGLTCSVGISAVKSVAKVASDMNKPDGLTVCPPGKEKEFLAPLPVTRLWGCGKKTTEMLHNHGIYRVQDISHYPLDIMTSLFGKNGAHLWYLANGIDPRSVHHLPDTQKSISEEITFEMDCCDTSVLYQQIKRICDSLTLQLHRKHQLAKTVTIKLRYSNFDTITRSYTLDAYSRSFYLLHDTAVRLFESIALQDSRVRLIGAGVTNLKNDSEEIQGNLFQNVLAQKKSLHDDIYQMMKEKYGKKISRASLLDIEHPHTGYHKP